MILKFIVFCFVGLNCFTDFENFPGVFFDQKRTIKIDPDVIEYINSIQIYDEKGNSVEIERSCSENNPFMNHDFLGYTAFNAKKTKGRYDSKVYGVYYKVGIMEDGQELFAYTRSIYCLFDSSEMKPNGIKGYLINPMHEYYVSDDFNVKYNNNIYDNYIYYDNYFNCFKYLNPEEIDWFNNDENDDSDWIKQYPEPFGSNTLNILFPDKNSNELPIASHTLAWLFKEADKDVNFSEIIINQDGILEYMDGKPFYLKCSNKSKKIKAILDKENSCCYLYDA